MMTRKHVLKCGDARLASYRMLSSRLAVRSHVHRQPIGKFTVHTIAQVDHAKQLTEFCNQSAITYGLADRVSHDDILKLLSGANWTALDGTVHSEDTPVTIEFVFPLARSGQMKLSNMRLVAQQPAFRQAA